MISYLNKDNQFSNFIRYYLKEYNRTLCIFVSIVKEKEYFMMKRKGNKRKWIIGGLLLYGIFTSIYFFVYSDAPNTTEQYVTMGGFFLIVLALHFVLKKKERLAQRREDDIINKKDKR